MNSILKSAFAVTVSLATLSVGAANASRSDKKTTPARAEVFASVRGDSLNFQIIKKQNPDVYIVERQSSQGKRSKKIPAGLAATIRADILNFIWTQEFTTPKKIGKCTVIAQIEVKQSNDLTHVCGEDQVAQRKLVALSGRLTRLIEN